ncbi:MAG: ThuA domain-containing protein, partial [Pirellulaceae bacterium]
LSEDPVSALALSPDGRLAVAIDDSMLRLTRFDNGQPLLTIVSLRDGQHLVIRPDGHYRGSPGVERELVYVTMTDSGEQITLTPQEFSKRYGWKNDPTKVVADMGDLKGFEQAAAPLPAQAKEKMPRTGHGEQTADARATVVTGHVPISKEDAQGNKIRVLLITGGHNFERDQFLALFDAMPDVAYGRAIHPAVAELLTPALAKQYDVLVFYDMWEIGFTAQQQKDFVELLNSDIGVVGLHSAIGSHQNWPEWGKILGGHFFREETTIHGRKVPASRVDWNPRRHNVTVSDPNHPITQGLNSFSILGESYKHVDRDPAIHVLLKTDQALNDPPVAWVKTYGKSRVFYLQFGASYIVFEHPIYGQLLVRAIRWTSGREPVSKAATQ